MRLTAIALVVNPWARVADSPLPHSEYGCRLQNPLRAFELFAKAVEEADKQPSLATILDQIAPLYLKLRQLEEEMDSGLRTSLTSHESEQQQLLRGLIDRAKTLPQVTIRMRLAQALNEYQTTSKVKKVNIGDTETNAAEILRTIATAIGKDRVNKEHQNLCAQLEIPLFETSPEVIGAIKQAERGDRIDLAKVEARVDAAFQSSAGDGIADQVIPGITSAGEQIPYFGRVLFSNPENDKRTVALLADSYLNNVDATSAAVQKKATEGNSMLWNIFGDAGAIAAGYASSALMRKTMPKLLERAGTAGKLGSFALQLLVAGETKVWWTTVHSPHPPMPPS